MSLPHRAPTGALRTQAGVKRSETPVKKSRKHIKFRRYDRNSVAPVGASICSYILCRGFAPLHHLPVFCRPYRGFNLFMHPLQGFRSAAPPACVLSPLSGLQYVHTSYAGVPLRCTTCLCPVAPIGACNLLMHPLQGFRSAAPPACVLSPLSGLQYVHTSYAGVPLRYTTCLCSVAPIGACNLLVHPLQGFRFALPLPVILTPLSGLAITIRIKMMPISIIIPYEL